MAASSRTHRVGRVTSNRGDKTIVVEVEFFRRHPVYGKRVRKRRKVMAHDPGNACRIGDRVEIEECRPISRRKRWRLFDVIERSELTLEEREAAFVIEPEVMGSTNPNQDGEADLAADQSEDVEKLTKE